MTRPRLALVLSVVGVTFGAAALLLALLPPDDRPQPKGTPTGSGPVDARTAAALGIPPCKPLPPDGTEVAYEDLRGACTASGARLAWLGFTDCDDGSDLRASDAGWIVVREGRGVFRTGPYQRAWEVCYGYTQGPA